MKMLAFALLAGLAMAGDGLAQSKTKMTIATGVDPSFSHYYIAKEGGYFEKRGLDVTLNTGPSGSAMVTYVIKNQVQSAFGAEIAGIQNHNLDGDVVMVAEGALLVKWYGLVGRDIADLNGLKGKKVGIARGSGSEVFWLAMLDKLKLDAKDYTIVQVEAPEMVAAIARKDIDAFSAWEPWITRATMAVPNSKVLRDAEGIIGGRVYIYMNKGWVIQNPAPAKEFLAALLEADNYIRSNPKEAAALVSKFLKLDLALTELLMPKLRHDIRLDQDSVDNFRIAEKQLKDQGKLAKPLDYKSFIYPDLLKALKPEKVNFKMPD